MPAPQHALQLYGIISLDVSGDTSPVRGVNVVTFRDLGALVADSPYAAPGPTPQNIAEYRRVVEAAFAKQTIVPAPFGSIFRAKSPLRMAGAALLHARGSGDVRGRSGDGARGRFVWRRAGEHDRHVDRCGPARHDGG